MTAENTIQWMMDFYPDLYPTRKHCLDQLFCVVGNGYKWVKGELVDSDPDEFRSRYRFKKNVVRAHSQNEDDWISQQQLHILKQTLDPDYQIPRAYRFKWFPVCHNISYIVNYPENITDSWKAALEECKQLLEADGIHIMEDVNE